MGTRHLIAVQIDGEYKIAQYGQWDGYPSGQGATVLAFISKVMADTVTLEHFKSNLRQTRWATEEEIEAAWVDAGAEQGAEFVSMDVGERLRQKYPQLSRDTGAEVLGLVLALPAPLALKNSIDFAMDSLYCEWAYVIDFDSNTFEVFKGFNKAPASGRFAGPVQGGGPDIYRLAAAAIFGNEGPGTEGYGPVQHAMTYPLDQLPSEEEFLGTLEPKEEEVE